MKKMNLKFFGLRAKMVLPLFMLLGLFLFGANSATAQSYKSLDDAANILKSELTLTIDQGGHAYNVSLTSPENTVLVASYEYYSYILQAISGGDIEVALDESLSKMKIKFPTNPMNAGIILAHNRAVELLTND
jgi:hypothetical protein